jgi:Tc5 transposase DNA-binding domain./DDE superfamily endonuclease.
LKTVAEELSVSRSQIYTIVRSKETLLRQWSAGTTANAKLTKDRVSAYADINKSVFNWFLTARQKNLPISGLILKEKAMEMARNNGMEQFCASNGWLYKFQRRHNINSRLLCGESAEVDGNIVSSWFDRLSTFYEGYSREDTFNADETGLLFRALPNRSLIKKGARSAGIKVSKDRMTVLLCCSATGEKLTPLIIGKYRNPRCLMRTDKKNWVSSMRQTKRLG